MRTFFAEQSPLGFGAEYSTRISRESLCRILTSAPTLVEQNARRRLRKRKQRRTIYSVRITANLPDVEWPRRSELT